MSVLRNLEAKLEGLVEGTFSRAFKSKVQPVELAHKLAKEMEENQTVSISRVYVPNEYVVFLSPKDRAQFEGYESALQKELSDYLLEHARSEGLALVTRPSVDFETDERLGLGEFGIQAHLVHASEDAEAEPQQGDFGNTMVYSPDRAPRRLVPPVSSGRAYLVGSGKRMVVSGDRFVVGRSREADMVVDDPNVSRQHLELRREMDGWVARDLGSTNGIQVNGRQVTETALAPGDQVTLGLTTLTFELE
jgi:hypothetical protein